MKTDNELIRIIANVFNELGYPCCRCMNCKTCEKAEMILNMMKMQPKTKGH